MVFQDDYFQTVCEYSIDELSLRQPGWRRRGPLGRGSLGRDARLLSNSSLPGKNRSIEWRIDDRIRKQRPDEK